jgi:hypothetical protein
MKHTLVRRFVVALGVGGLIGLSITACGTPAPQTTPPIEPPAGVQPTTLPTPLKPNVTVAPDEPQIYVLEPNDTETINPLVTLRVGASNFKLPLDNVVIHIAIDAPCTPPGEIVPEDAQHRRFDQGLITAPVLSLPAGQHRLCLQASGTNDIALDGAGMMRIIDVNVVVPPTTRS